MTFRPDLDPVGGSLLLSALVALLPLATIFVTLGALAGITEAGIFGLLAMLVAVAWVVLTIVGGAKAAQGEVWKNPVKQVLKLQVLSEK